MFFKDIITTTLTIHFNIIIMVVILKKSFLMNKIKLTIGQVSI